MKTELTRPVRLQQIGASGMPYSVVASEAECRDLAVRLQIPAVLALACEFQIAPPSGDLVAVTGTLGARVVQTCVVSLDEFVQDVVEDFELQFVPEDAVSDDLDPDLPDDIPYSGDVIDLGEAAAEQLALALDPYPRKPDAVAADPETPVASPFSSLGKLRR